MKKISIFLCTLSVLLLGFGTAYATMITGLTKIGGDTDLPNPKIVEGGLVSGALSYVDRSAFWNVIPDYLLGIDYVMTENDDKLSGVANEKYSVEIGMDGLLHIFVDQRLGAPSAANLLTWLTDNTVVSGGFTKTGDIVLQDFDPYNGAYDGDFGFDVWTATVTAGSYELGEQTGESFYGIAASPIPEPATMLLLGFGLAGLAGFRKTFYSRWIRFGSQTK